MTTDTLRDEFDYYLENQDSMVEKYDGKVVVIKDKSVIGSYSDEGEAVAATLPEHELGTFLVQRVSAGDEAYTIRLASSRAFFA